MFKYIYYIFIICPVLLQAQSLSIEQLVSNVLENNISKQNIIELQLSQQDIILEKLNRYPIVYGDINVQRNLIVPTTPVPAIAFDPSAAEDVYLPLKFSTKWNSKAGVQVEWKVFNPTQRLLEKQKKINSKKVEIQQQEDKKQLINDATLAYASIVLASLQHAAALEDSTRYEQIVQTTRYRYEQGRESADELLKAEQDLERKKIQIFETWSILRDANLELFKYIDIKKVERLSTSIDEIILTLRTYSNNNFKSDLIEQDLLNNEIEKNILKKQLLPTLTVNGYYGAQYFNEHLNLTNKTNWYGNSYISLALRLPITDYLVQNKYLEKNILEAKLNNLKLQESYKNHEIEQQQKSSKIKATELKIQSLKKILSMSEELIKNKQINYENGRILMADYKKVLIEHNANLQDLWQTQYDMISLLIH